jgi:hypothetical protein
LKDNTNCEEIQDCISNSGCHWSNPKSIRYMRMPSKHFFF